MPETPNIADPPRPTEEATDFQAHRGFLAGLAYRMLGSVAEAEDVVQDAFLRWREVDRRAVAEPRGYLARVVSRLCLDRMKSASHRREQYVGMWLPEPVVAEPAHDLADDLSVALLLALERLSPLERAAFLLHDVFDMDYAAVAETLEANEAACRQLAARAREHVRQDRPRYPPSETEARQIADAFVAAAASGDLAGLARLLADGAVLYADGGGKRRTALNPIAGKDRIVRFYDGLKTKGSGAFTAFRVDAVTLNGLPGFVFHTPDGPHTLAIQIAAGAIVALYFVSNPDKVSHLS
ncbi:MAG TPA: sigma-70 family RNA polymerase sigma factor [Polyangia bacterium]|nr:sigma-70 family RNA polymerase sigma factor [Polyangia bacterium]